MIKMLKNMIPNLVGMFPVGDLAKGFQKGLRVIIITVLAFNILAVLLLWMGVFKPHKTSHVAGQTTPAPEPVLNLMPVRHYDADGLQFSYYADWTIEKGVPIDGATTLRSIRIEERVMNWFVWHVSHRRVRCRSMVMRQQLRMIAQRQSTTKRARGHRMPPMRPGASLKPSPRKWPATITKASTNIFQSTIRGFLFHRIRCFFRSREPITKC